MSTRPRVTAAAAAFCRCVRLGSWVPPCGVVPMPGVVPWFGSVPWLGSLPWLGSVPWFGSVPWLGAGAFWPWSGAGWLGAGRGTTGAVLIGVRDASIVDLWSGSTPLTTAVTASTAAATPAPAAISALRVGPCDAGAGCRSGSVAAMGAWGHWETTVSGRPQRGELQSPLSCPSGPADEGVVIVHL